MKKKFTIIATAKTKPFPPSSVYSSSISFFLEDYKILSLKTCDDFEDLILSLRNRGKFRVFSNCYFSLFQMKRLNAFLNDCFLKYFDYTLNYEVLLS